MKLLTKLNPVTCPQVIAEINRRIAEYPDRANTTVYQALEFARIDGAIWHVAVDWSANEPFANKWNDMQFGFPPILATTATNTQPATPGMRFDGSNKRTSKSVSN